MRKLKTGDVVRVMSGKDSGKEGKILKVVQKVEKNGVKKTQVIIEGVNIVKKAQKPNQAYNIPGGIIEFEKPVDISNVMYLEEGVPIRLGFKVDLKTGKKTRVSKKTGKVID
ncbi:MAG: 50S ribosomal protein L24 [Candidatus Dojkabacteria bacterium]|nr:50S ribosomal protein L24 [Candidatus Dojkabacteria bacterium]MDQ7021379.1 50S ribosomal protein L24 [Candidatus Dojkabacteria bacterium]